MGMILVNANVSGDFNDAEQSNDDPLEILQKIDNLEGKLNTVENTTAVSVVFLMKSSGVRDGFGPRRQRTPAVGSMWRQPTV